MISMIISTRKLLYLPPPLSISLLQKSPEMSTTLISKTTVFPDQPSTMAPLKLSVSDLPMLSCHSIQKGCLFTLPKTHPTTTLMISLLQHALSRTLSVFPPLAGRLETDENGHVYITCNDAGVHFRHAKAKTVSIYDILATTHVHDCFKQFFAMDHMVSFAGHFNPLLAVQVTELADGVFIGCTVNHAVTDGTSFWNFFNTFAEMCRGVKMASKMPDFTRNSVLISPAVLQVPVGGPKVTFDVDAPICQRIFSFSREAILELKARVNSKSVKNNMVIDNSVEEMFGKQMNDPWTNLKACSEFSKMNDVSSFQALCALLWRAVTRSRKFPSSKMTTFRMAVNVRHRLTPKLDPLYFGNAIQSIPTYATAGDVLSHNLCWCAEQLNKSVKAYDDAKVEQVVKEWEANPRCFPLGNFDGAMLTMGSSPRFPMYDNDFGWGRPLAVRSGKANKFDGKISAFPGREGGGSVDLEVVLAPETMAGVEADEEFMEYVTVEEC